MMKKHKQIKRLTNGKAIDDGEWISFYIQTMDGEEIPIVIKSENVKDTVAFLIGLAQLAQQKKPKDSQKRVVPKPAYEAPLIEAEAVFFTEGRTPQEVVLAFQVGDFGLGFAIEANALSDLRAALENMAPSRPHQRH